MTKSAKFFWIDEKLCGSSYLNDDNCDEMLEQGIKGVVCLRRTILPPSSCIHSNFVYCHIPVNPSWQIKSFLLLKILKYLRFVKQVFGPVLTFCLEGCDRTCVFLACYLVSEHHMSSKEAITWLMSCRKCGFTSCPFSYIVKSFEHFLKAPVLLKIFFIF